MNGFVAFSINESSDERTRVMAILEEKFGGLGWKLHDSGDVFKELFADTGSWDGFIEKVSLGTDYYTRNPLFEMVICTDMVFGRATSSMVSNFISQNKIAVYADVDANEYVGISDVFNHDENDWKTGWSLRLAI
tara:strand:+ start:89 stop:490 length:402 start_codon:yes stop_codon:yes gene_type:complete